MKRILVIFLTFIGLTLAQQAPILANEETLDQYWPMHAPSRIWNLIESKSRDVPNPKAMMAVISNDVGVNRAELWFLNKPSQPVGKSDIERYEYCGNTGGEPWLFLTEYADSIQGKPSASHSVQAIRILFTPYNGQTIDLIADGTYARCGSKGQPYLYWKQNLESYRIQVWGLLSENPKWQWYWDATVSKPALVTNDCLRPAQTIKAIKVQEAWWSNFKWPAGKWSLGSGGVGVDGLPEGDNVKYGRTVWHAQGQVPYYLIGGPDGKKINWCVSEIMPVQSPTINMAN